MKTDAPSYHGYRFPPEIISHAVWLYHRVPQSGNGRTSHGERARRDGELAPSGSDRRVRATQDASNHCPTSYRKDDGRPVEVGYQEQASNHLKRLSLRAAVVSVEETLSKTRQVWIRKTNVSKPLLTRREPEHDIETGGGWYLRDKSGGCPECRPGGVRRAGGVSLIQAFLWNCGNQSS